jgi:hypothetical protein
VAEAVIDEADVRAAALILDDSAELKRPVGLPELAKIAIEFRTPRTRSVHRGIRDGKNASFDRGVCGGLPAQERVRFATAAALVNELAEAKHQLQRRRVLEGGGRDNALKNKGRLITQTASVPSKAGLAMSCSA